jgi:hypothetical protein
MIRGAISTSSLLTITWATERRAPKRFTLRDILGADLKVVLIAGDTSSAIKELRRDDRVRMTSKPINVKELRALLSQLLEN